MLPYDMLAGYRALTEIRASNSQSTMKDWVTGSSIPDSGLPFLTSVFRNAVIPFYPLYIGYQRLLLWVQSAIS